MRSSDEQLLERLAAGDRRAFEALYGRYEQPLFAFARALVGDGATAEDVVHEAFVVVLKGKAPQGVSSFRAWLYQVARNACANRTRGRRREETALGLLGRDGAVAASPADGLEGSERQAQLEGAVDQLAPDEAALFRLRARGLSYAELAGVFSVPTGTIKSRLHLLVRRLREALT